ncbi:hypothetical protein D5086_029025 [Populus alba]|uniref:Uncharacterized protein n=1 Tax=Populus alba TaxID=43335 RepID=A0ACC4ASH7_POPAL
MLLNLLIMATSDHSFAYYCCLCIAWSTIVIVVVQLFIKTSTSFGTKTRHPPSPPGLPIIGHLHLLSSDLPNSLKTLASRYGPLMKIRFGSTPIYVVSDAKTAKEILKIHDVDFASKFTLGFGLSKFDIYDGYTFFNAPYGAYWRFMKKLCMTKLFNGSQLDRFVHIREQETMKLLKSLVDKSREGKPCDLGEELSVFASNIICRMVIGNICVEDPNLPTEIRKLVGDIMENAAKFSFNEVFGPLNRFDLLGKGKGLASAIRKYDKLLEQLMKKYEDNFDKLSSSCDEEQRDVMIILMEAYKDTNSELLKESDVPKLPFLQAVVKETLRFNPIATLRPRQCDVDTRINGYDIEAGTRILINAYAIMRDSDSWEKPDDFFPERFLADSTDTNSDHHRPAMDFKAGDHDFHFLPFGSGRRACVAASHGLIVTHATIGALVQCFDWEVKDDAKIDNELATGYSGSRALPLACYPITRFDPTNA